jgi:hypothetical protein
VRFRGRAEGATWEENQPGRRGVAWWSWTAAVAGPHAIRGFTLEGWPVPFAVYSGAILEDLVLVLDSDQTGGSAGGHLRFEAVAGNEYAIAVTDNGSGLFTMEILPTSPPELTFLDPSAPIRLNPGSILRVEVAATDPDSGIAQVDLYRDTWLVGSLESPPFVWLLPMPRFDAYGVLHAVAVDRAGAVTVSEEIRLRIEPAPPVNDRFAERMLLAPLGTEEIFDLRGATLEENEPNPLGIFGSAWWSWEAPADGPFTIMIQSDQRGPLPALTVFTGTDLSSLFLVGQGPTEFLREGPSARLTFSASAGTIYQLAVTGGQFSRLRVVPSAPPTIRVLAPDDFSTWSEGTPILLRAEAEDSDGSITEVVWLLEDSLRTAERSTETHFELFHAPSVLGSERFITIQARATDDVGLWTWSNPVYLQILPLPARNDAFADRDRLAGYWVRVSIEQGPSSIEPDEPEHDGWERGSIWYSWTAPETGIVVLAVSGDRIGSLRVFHGNDISTLVEVAFDAEPAGGPGHGTTSRMRQAVFLARAGVEYAMRLGSIESGGFWAAAPDQLRLWFEPRRVSDLRVDSDGGMHFRFITSSERDWSVERSTDLRVWEPRGIRRSVGGHFEFIDPEAGGFSRFYRISPLP